MRIAMVIFSMLFTLLVFSATDALADDEIYRWVDENGVVHFGDRADEHANAEKISIQTSRGVNSQPPGATAATGISQAQNPEPSYAQQRRDERAERHRKAAEKQAAIDAGCEQRHQLVAQMEPSTRVMATTEDGTVVRMDDNDRLEILDEAKAYIAKNCEK